MPTAAQAAAAEVKPEGYHVLEDGQRSAAADRSYVSVTCPVCGTLIRAPEEQAGRKTTCPDCRTAVVVPRSSQPKAKRPRALSRDEGYGLNNEWDGSGGRPRVQGPSYIPVYCPLCNTLMQATADQVGQKIACPDCGTSAAVPPPPSKRRPGPAAAEVEGSAEYALLEEGRKPVDRPLVAASCPVCNARLHVGQEQVGRETVCPDCRASFVVPAPPPRRRPVVRPESGAEYALADSPTRGQRPVESGGEPDRRPQPGAEPAEAPRRRPPPRWALVCGVSGFPIYRSVWVRWVALSLLAILAEQLLANGLNLGNTGDGRSWLIGAVLFGLAIYFGTIWIAILTGCGVTIVRETAAGNEQIENWPDAAFFDWIGDSLFVLSALAIGALPGLGIAAFSGLSGAPRWYCLAGSLWATFPVAFLSMLESESFMIPLSPPVLRSLAGAWADWGLFYVETGVLATTAGWIAAEAVAFGTPVAAPVLLPALVALLLIYFRLLGRLAWRCAEEPGRTRTAETDQLRDEEQPREDEPGSP